MKLLLLSVFLAMFTQGEAGRVEIVVRDAATDETLPGVPVKLTLKPFGEPDGPSSTIVTDPRGVALFSGLVNGTYVPSFTEPYRAASTLGFLVLDSGERQRVDLRVQRLANISVRVLDPEGKPVKDAVVRLASTGYVDGRRALMTGLELVRDSGSDLFRVPRVFPGEYYVRIERPESGRGPLSLISYYPGTPDIQSAARVNVNGQDVQLADVRLGRQNLFKVSGVLPLPILMAPPLRGRGAADTPTIRLYVVLDEASSIEQPIALTSVRYSPGANPNETRFEIDGLPAGTHAIYLRSTVGDTQGISKTILTVRDQDIDGVRIPTPDKLRTTGTVVIDGPSREVLDDIRVRALARDYFYQAASAGPARETGKFTFESLSEGVRYGLSVLGLPDDAYVQDIRRRNLSIFNEGSFLASAGLPDLEVEIRMVGATVRGLVRDAANQPVQRATVVLVPDSQRRANALLYKRGTTDAEGNFTIKGVAPGEYQTFAWRVGPPIGAEQNGDFIAPYAGRGTTIRATQAVVSEMQLRVIEAR